jgi:methionine-gamma-lyase
MKKDLKPETLMMEAGFDPKKAMNSAKPPVYMTSTFVFDTAEDGEEFFQAVKEGRDAGLIYSRMNNPNLDIFEQRLCVFDGADKGAAFASGMGAIFTTVSALSQPGGYMIYLSPVYGGTEVLLDKYMPHLGVRCIGVRAGDDAAKRLEETVAKEGDKPFMVLVESPANPSIEMTDIGEVAAYLATLGDENSRPYLAVDNTFMGPVFSHPMHHGADVVLYSTTKFIGGHSDMVGGAAVGKAEPMKKIRSWRNTIGTTMSAYSAWLATRSLETVDVRMRKCAENASKIAAMLQEHADVMRVAYPEQFEPGSKQREIYEKQCSGPGALISFDVASKKIAFKFLNNLHIFTLAVSLGGNESLAEHPAAHTHSGVPKEIRDKIGVNDCLVRLSVGLENVDDLIDDIKQALAIAVE